VSLTRTFRDGRRETGEVLKCLSSLIQDSEPVVVLHGPAGIGKSMLLGVLLERFGGERRVAYASIGEVPEPELCHRILDERSEPTAGATSATRDYNICGNTTLCNRFDGVPQPAQAFEKKCGPIIGEQCVN
jgi:hypothetical protein